MIRNFAALRRELWINTLLTVEPRSFSPKSYDKIKKLQGTSIKEIFRGHNVHKEFLSWPQEVENNETYESRSESQVQPEIFRNREISKYALDSSNDKLLSKRKCSLRVSQSHILLHSTVQWSWRHLHPVFLYTLENARGSRTYLVNMHAYTCCYIRIDTSGWCRSGGLCFWPPQTANRNNLLADGSAWMKSSQHWQTLLTNNIHRQAILWSLRDLNGRWKKIGNDIHTYWQSDAWSTAVVDWPQPHMV